MKRTRSKYTKCFGNNAYNEQKNEKNVIIWGSLMIILYFCSYER